MNEILTLATSVTCGHGEKAAIYTPANRLSPDTKSAGILTLNFPASETVIIGSSDIGYHTDKLQKHYSVSVREHRLCNSIHLRCPKLVNPQNQKADW